MGYGPDHDTSQAERRSVTIQPGYCKTHSPESLLILKGAYHLDFAKFNFRPSVSSSSNATHWLVLYVRTFTAASLYRTGVTFCDCIMSDISELNTIPTSWLHIHDSEPDASMNHNISNGLSY